MELQNREHELSSAYELLQGQPEEKPTRVTEKEAVNLCATIIPVLINVLNLRHPLEHHDLTMFKVTIAIFIWCVLVFTYMVKVNLDVVTDALMYYYTATINGKKIFYEKFPSILLGWVVIVYSLGLTIANLKSFHPITMYWLSVGASLLTTTNASLQLIYNDKDISSLTVEQGIEVVQKLERSMDHARRGRMLIYVRDRNHQPFRI